MADELNPISAARARELLGVTNELTKKVNLTFAHLTNPLVNGSTVPKGNSGIACDHTDACPADAYGLAR
ncbi:hypothetical protein MMB17_12740 [Methylobacterium organophilum]|uniref:hypothetical protein n=1 Tax=Methylobacterium organophilum TaxID=410 RepID=UPI001F13AEBA|nr:hypothetical protein [Methylobacterium organophilum]UMY15623.1 hypothetical protein MMB17_12740 [Methylobacterium organophilum]